MPTGKASVLSYFLVKEENPSVHHIMQHFPTQRCWDSLRDKQVPEHCWISAQICQALGCKALVSS